jgi:hypothetical protein
MTTINRTMRDSILDSERRSLGQEEIRRPKLGF